MEFLDCGGLPEQLPSEMTTPISEARRLWAAGDRAEAARQYREMLREPSIATARLCVYNSLGINFVEDGRHDLAIASFEEALRLAELEGYVRAEALVAANIGTLFDRESRWADAKVAYEQSLRIFEKIGMTGEAAKVREALKDVVAGEAVLLTTSLRLDNETKKSRAAHLNNLGRLHLDLDDHAKAISYFQEAEKAATEEVQSQLQATILNNLAVALKSQANFDDAKTCYLQAVAIAQRTGDTKNLATSWNNLGLLLKELKEYDAAVQAFKQSLNIKQASGQIEFCATSLFNLAKLYLETGDLSQAEDYALRARSIDEDYGSGDIDEDDALLNRIRTRIN